MKKVAKKFKFEGWDYFELAEAWGLNDVEPDENHAQRVEDRIKETISLCYWNCGNKGIRSSKVYKDCRAFMKALVKCSADSNDGHTSYYAGIAGLKDPGIFLDRVAKNLEQLWT